VLRAEKSDLELGLQNPDEWHPEEVMLFLKTACYYYRYAYCRNTL